MRNVLLAALLAAGLPHVAQANVPAEHVSFQPQVKGLELPQAGDAGDGQGADRDDRPDPDHLDLRRPPCPPLPALSRQGHRLPAAGDIAPARRPRPPRSIESVGGVGTYSNGLVHVDVGDRELAWHGHRKSRRQLAYAVAVAERRRPQPAEYEKTGSFRSRSCSFTHAMRVAATRNVSVQRSIRQGLPHALDLFLQQQLLSLHLDHVQTSR